MLHQAGLCIIQIVRQIFGIVDHEISILSIQEVCLLEVRSQLTSNTLPSKYHLVIEHIPFHVVHVEYFTTSILREQI